MQVDGKANILVVDDNPAKRLAIRSMLEDLNQNVVTAESGQDALRLLLSNEYAVIVMDVQMPTMDGFETAALIRSRQQSEVTPIIFVTAYARAETDMVQGYSHAPVDYVFTPIIPEILRAKVSVFLDLFQKTQALKRNVAHLENLVEQQTAALHSSGERFHDLVQGVDAIVWEADTQTLQFTFVSRQAEVMLGYPLARWLTEPTFWVDHIYPEDREQAVAFCRAAVAQGKNHQFEYRMLAADDRVVWLREIVRAPVEPDGSVRQLRGLSIDITKHRVNEAKSKRLNRIYSVRSGINTTIVRVREPQELFDEACRIAVEHGQFMFAWIGTIDAGTQQITPVTRAGRDDGYLDQINLTAMADTPGNCRLTAEAIAQAKPVICNDIAGDDRIESLRGEALKRGYRSAVVLPLMLEGKLVGVFVLYASETDVFDEEEMTLLTEMTGDISYALENFRFEARHKQAEDEWRNLSQAVEQSPSLIAITDLDANFEYVNDAFVKVTGYSRAEVIGQSPAILQSGKNSRETYDDMWAHLTRGAVWKGELINRRKDGSEYIQSSLISCVRDSSGQVTHYLATHEDITERTLAEAAVRQRNQELENNVTARTTELEQARLEADQANRAKSAFLATMSHEIRTPMNGVVGMVDVLHQTSLKGYQVEMLDLIRESAFSLLEIIDDILDVSKIEAGKLEIEQAPMPVADVVEKACGLLDHLASKKGVELTLFVDPAIPEEVMGDALRLRQVLLNLANNAIKFSSGQQRPGHVSVRAILVNNGLAGRNPGQVIVEFQIADNGIGMSEETMARLFTPFSQADFTTTRRFGGTGLGLAISHHLVDMMGGEIAVQSALGKGSTFTVRLPLSPLPAKPKSGDKVVDLSGLSCLVLGGNEGLGDGLAVYLTHGGARVERALDLAAAYKLIGTLPPGLWIFIIDVGHDTAPVEELRAACHARLNLDPRFVVIDRGHDEPGVEPSFVVAMRGRRRHGRTRAMDIVTMDGDGMHRQSFLRAVALAAGRVQPRETPLPGEMAAITKPSREEALQRGQLILVAEDNEINQKVILQQLGLFGYTADVTADGRAALERWQSGNYALLLSDLHMPNMDGYQLTAAIRAAEIGNAHMPIIALTANAVKGEAEHCRAAGMDDYLSKPARLADLKAMLEKWLPVAAESRPAAPMPVLAAPTALSAAAAYVPVDTSVLEALVSNDPAVIREFLLDFRVSAAKTAAELKAACDNAQAAQAGALAHKLKSSARWMGALALGELCDEIEQAGQAGQVEALPGLLSRFEAEMSAVDKYLDSIASS